MILKSFELDKINKVHVSLLNKECDYECDTFLDMKYLNKGTFRVLKIETFEKSLNFHRFSFDLSSFFVFQASHGEEKGRPL